MSPLVEVSIIIMLKKLPRMLASTKDPRKMWKVWKKLLKT